jgi:hypothetical protein
VIRVHEVAAAREAITVAEVVLGGREWGSPDPM